MFRRNRVNRHARPDVPPPTVAAQAPAASGCRPRSPPRPPPMFRPIAPPLAAVLAGAVLIGAAAGCGGADAAGSAAPVAAPADVADLEDQVAELAARVEALTAAAERAADRAAGEDPAAAAALDRLLAAVADPAATPDAARLGAWAEELTAVRADLSPLAEARLLPAANAVAWVLAARRLEGDAVDGAWLAEVDALLAVAPDRVPAASRTRLAVRRAEAVNRWVPALLETDAPAAGELEAALAAFPEGEHPWEAELTALLDARDAAARRSAAAGRAPAEAAAYGKTLEAVRDLPADLRRPALARLGGAVEAAYLSLRVDAGVPGSDLTDAGWDGLRADLAAALDQETEAAAAEARARADAARRGYQAWALGQIEIARRTVELGDARSRVEGWFEKMEDRPKERTWDDLTRFPEARRYLNEQAGTAVGADGVLTKGDQAKIFKAAGGENWTGSWRIAGHLARLINRDTFKDLLLPIDERLLDPPVARFYHKVFDEGWASLDGSPDFQLDIAEVTAEAPKKPLSDFLDD